MSVRAVAIGAPRSAGGALLPLTRVEAKRLLRHPAVLGGALLSVLAMWGLDRDWSPGGDYLAVVGAGAFPVALGTMLAANLSALRSARSGTLELHGSLPSPPHLRPLAQLLALGAPAVLACALTAAAVVAFGGTDGFVVTQAGETRFPSPAELGQGPAAVAVLGALGIALARWVPLLPVASVAAVAMALLELPLATWNLQTPAAWLAPVVSPARAPAPDVTGSPSWPCEPDRSWPCGVEYFASASMGWHLLYLGGAALALGASALLRDGAGWTARVATVVGASAAVAGAVLQLP